MRLNFRKLEVRDLREVEQLITAEADALEPGLEIVDSSVLLGHARIDLVGLDAKETLVLVALGFAANDEMFLRALDAYCWCLDFPDTVRRLYPRARTQSGRPPRIVFVAETLPETFLRKVKHLVFAEVDCLKFLHLDVNGTPAMFFDPVERIRRGQGMAPARDEFVDAPDRLDQHDFIEGTPPLAWTPAAPSPRNGTRALHEPRPEESKPAGTKAAGPAPEPSAATPAGSPPNWEAFLREMSPRATAEDEATTEKPAAEADARVAPGAEAGAFAEGLGTLHRVLGGGEASEQSALSQEWRSFLSQLKASDKPAE